MELNTWSDVRAEIARSGFSKRAVAERMGLSPVEFSRLINAPDTAPLPAWVERFEGALEALKAETASPSQPAVS